MVESAPAQGQIRFSMEDMDQNCRLTFQPDYFECPICCCIPTGSKIVECTNCKARACVDCLKNFTKKDTGHNVFKCTICLKEQQMVPPNKLMMQLLQKLFKFECEKCERYWSYEDYIMHNLQGRCLKEPFAENNVAKLNENQQPMNLTQSIAHIAVEKAKKAEEMA